MCTKGTNVNYFWGEYNQIWYFTIREDRNLSMKKVIWRFVFSIYLEIESLPVFQLILEARPVEPETD